MTDEMQHTAATRAHYNVAAAGSMRHVARALRIGAQCTVRGVCGCCAVGLARQTCPACKGPYVVASHLHRQGVGRNRSLAHADNIAR